MYGTPKSLDGVGVSLSTGRRGRATPSAAEQSPLCCLGFHGVELIFKSGRFAYCGDARTCLRMNCAPEHVFILSEIILLVGGAVPPAPVVPTSTRISARLKRAGNAVHP